MKDKYTFDKSFLYMALMTLPITFVMPVMIAVPLVLLVFSIKKRNEQQ